MFLLSCTEANKYFNVTFENSGNTKARVKPTAYAVKRGTLTNSNYKTEEGKAAGWWWLRSPGFKSHGAARVYTAGSLRHCDVNSVDACVRPAMWVNLDSEIFRSEN